MSTEQRPLLYAVERIMQIMNENLEKIIDKIDILERRIILLETVVFLDNRPLRPEN